MRLCWSWPRQSPMRGAWPAHSMLSPRPRSRWRRLRHERQWKSSGRPSASRRRRRSRDPASDGATVQPTASCVRLCRYKRPSIRVSPRPGATSSDATAPSLAIGVALELWVLGCTRRTAGGGAGGSAGVGVGARGGAAASAAAASGAGVGARVGGAVNAKVGDGPRTTAEGAGVGARGAGCDGRARRASAGSVASFAQSAVGAGGSAGAGGAAGGGAGGGGAAAGAATGAERRATAPPL